MTKRDLIEILEEFDDNTEIRGDNYAVWEKCGYCGDDYSGYMLFPTHNKNEYFVLYYNC